MKKTLLIILLMIISSALVFALTTEERTLVAILNNGQSTGSYRVGFASSHITSLEGVPSSLSSNSLSLSVKDGEFRATNNEAYLFFQIISTIKEPVKLYLGMTKLTNGTDTIDWTIRFNPITGVMNGNTISTANGTDPVEIYSFTGGSGGISTYGSTQIYAYTDGLGVDDDNKLFEGDFTGTLTLYITSGDATLSVSGGN